MRKVMFGFAAIAAGVALTGSAMAQSFNVPAKAKGLKGEFVTAYAACETPVPGLTSNPPIALPGCTPVQETPSCQFGSKGAGKFSAGVSKTDVKVSAGFSGITCPDNTVLTVGVNSVVTTEDCTSGPNCTLQVPAGFPIGTCSVLAGKCSVKGTVEGFLGNTTVFKDGKVVAIEIDGIDVFAGATRAFTAGVRLGPQ